MHRPHCLSVGLPSCRRLARASTTARPQGPGVRPALAGTPAPPVPHGAPQGRGALGPPSWHSFPVPAPALLWRRPMGIRSSGKPRPVILRWPVAQSHENAVVPKGFELISLQRCHVRTDGVHRSGAAPRDLHCPSQSACWGEVGAYPARTAPAVPWALSRCKRWLRQKILSTLQE